MNAIKIEIVYDDGTVGTFWAGLGGAEGGAWRQMIHTPGHESVNVTGYEPPDVMRVLANAVGTREIGE